MVNLLKTGFEFLANTLKSHASQTVVYQRDDLSVAINATFGKTTYQVTDDSGVQIGGEIVDFLFQSADLILDGQIVTPQTGDKIVTDRAIYEIQFLGDGCWRYSDPFGKMIRLHTKEVSNVINN